MTHYLIDVCPQCKKRVEYAPNPAYWFTCPHCGWDGCQTDLLRMLDGAAIDKTLAEIEGLESRFEVYREEKA
jgi:transcription initiation factor IIE alpha subunit